VIKLAAFLGNPGNKYAKNRHNAARMLAQALPFYSDLYLQKKFKGLYAAYDNARFLMPETFMNLSGESVQAAASFFDVSMEEIIIVHDELELPLGTLSLKFSGGLGGHNGLRSMKKCFDSADFWRLRIGIGRPDTRLPGEGGPAGSGEGVYDWVLSDFSEAENVTLNPVLNEGAKLLMQLFSSEPADYLKEWSKKKILMPETI